MTDEPLSHRLAREICEGMFRAEWVEGEGPCKGPDCPCWEGVALPTGTAMAEEVARHAAEQVRAARLEAADIADRLACRRQTARQVAIRLRRLAGKGGDRLRSALD